MSLIPPGQAIGEFFRAFEHTAYRLEVRDRYDASHEDDSLRKFLIGEPDDLLWMQNWRALLSEATAQGRRLARVRVVSLPLTDYCRFGIWCAQFANRAGEDVRYLDRGQAGTLKLPDHDYWLFDSRLLLRMHFDDQDAFLGGEVVKDTGEIVQHNYWRDAAWHHAIRRDDFAAQQRLELP